MAHSARIPTEDAPEIGEIALFGIKLSDGERWEQDGDFVFRSTEFDVVTAGATFEEGLRRFGSELLRFAAYLVELDDLAENETEMLRAIQPRVLAILERAKAEADEGCDDESARTRRPRTSTRERRRDDHASRWRPTSNRRTSTRLSPA
jgi:hypothetical protein